MYRFNLTYFIFYLYYILSAGGIYSFFLNIKYSICILIPSTYSMCEKLSIYIYICMYVCVYIYIYIYIRMCVCVCVRFAVLHDLPVALPQKKKTSIKTNTVKS